MSSLRDWGFLVSGARVGWTLRLGTIIVVAILILVSKFEIGFGQAERSHESIARCDCDLSTQGVKNVRRHRSVEDLYVVASRWDMRDADLATRIRNPVVGRIYGDDYCTHLCVDVAENV